MRPQIELPARPAHSGRALERARQVAPAVVLVFVLLGCGNARSNPVSTPTPAPTLVTRAPAATVLALWEGELVPPFGGLIEGVTVSEATTNAACEGCHESAHPDAFTQVHQEGLRNAEFQKEFALDRNDFCTNCHAPLGAVGSLGAEQGVGCATCHVRGESVITFSSTSDSGQSPHALQAFVGDASSATCMPCHQFPFPTREVAPRSAFDPNEPLQNTFREWDTSLAKGAGQTCVTCHLESTPTETPVHVSGAFRGRSLRLSLIADEQVGHALPTGDVFAALLVVARDEEGNVLSQRELRRVFLGTRGLTGRVLLQEARDTRVPPPGNGDKEVRLNVGAASVVNVEVLRSRAGQSLSQERTTSDAPTRQLWSGQFTRDDAP